MLRQGRPLTKAATSVKCFINARMSSWSYNHLSNLAIIVIIPSKYPERNRRQSTQKLKSLPVRNRMVLLAYVLPIFMSNIWFKTIKRKKQSWSRSLQIALPISAHVITRLLTQHSTYETNYTYYEYLCPLDCQIFKYCLFLLVSKT